MSNRQPVYLCTVIIAILHTGVSKLTQKFRLHVPISVDFAYTHHIHLDLNGHCLFFCLPFSASSFPA
jgi:hypothetical protein